MLGKAVVVGALFAAMTVLLCPISSASASSFGFAPGAEGLAVAATNPPVVGGRFSRPGSEDVDAGSHPFAFTTGFRLETTTNEKGQTIPVEDPKDIEVQLPAGFVGDPTATPRCALQDFRTQRPGPFLPESSYEFSPASSCPASTQVGVAALGIQDEYLWLPVYNLVPEPGLPAEFGFSALGIPVLLRPTVRTGGDYGLTVEARNINQYEPVVGGIVTFWGVPGDPRHDPFRGACLGAYGENEAGETNVYVGIYPATVQLAEHECRTEAPPKPLLTMPTSCPMSPLVARIHADSWQERGRVNGEGDPDMSDPRWVTGESSMPPVSGCDRLAFSPQISFHPDTTSADSPSGLSVELRLPYTDAPEGREQAALKKAVVTLPVGMSVSPSAATGLGACTPAEIGFEDVDSSGLARFSPGPASCPDASKIGSAEIISPVLEEPLAGGVYLAQPSANPFGSELEPGGSLLAVYIVAEGDGVRVKLPGHVTADPVTGQLTATFDNNPQQPFTDLKLTFFGGPRGALVTPPGCGTYAIQSALTPYSTGLPVLSESQFAITSGCVSKFQPSLSAGNVSSQAGAYSPFSLTLSRSDEDQNISEISVLMPPGLLGVLAKVPLCGDAQAATGACPAASMIGHTTVGAGPGPDPVFLPEAGRPADPVYLTGPYNGGPFGLAIVVPAQAGPFDLGTVVVRAAIDIDPHTGQVLVKSDPLPTILKGIPIQLKTVNVTIDREGGFTFNPTNCNAFAVYATVTSTQHVSTAVSSPFHASGCASLPFKAKLTASTEGRATFNHNGASLKVSVQANQGPQSNPATPAEANIHKVDVQLPKALPARLTTLQKACGELVFAANPASCPPESDVGTATARTPLLTVPLTGPAYLVSHGGKAFPELVIILQGDGVKLQLQGETLIKGAITYSMFETVPDAPVSSFELNLPESPHSALASPSGSLCGKTLTMPVTMEGQNGAVIKQSTNVAVTGCTPKATITSKKISGKSVELTVTATASGTITISGAGVKRYHHSITAGTHKLTIPLTATKHRKSKLTTTLKSAHATTHTHTTLTR